MKIGVPKEWAPGEARVSLAPDSAKNLIEQDHQVRVQSGAGRQAGFLDEAYQSVGCELVDSAEDLIREVDLVTYVNGPDPNLNDQYGEGQIIVGLLDPYRDDDQFQQLSDRGVTAFALELMPRISRAQSMDALSSQSNIGGYKSVILAAKELPKIFPMMMTAAGTIRPANVLVIGAGVAGLQAIATAQRLGAQVEAYDIRLEVKEQVESLGADFVELDLETEEAEGESGYAREMDEEFYAKQRERLTEVLEYSEVVITTANIPGKPAPELVTEAMVDGMEPGSVIVDLAAANGGNCTLTEADEIVTHNDVTIIGPTNLPATVPSHASELYSNNIESFLGELTEDGELNLDRDDEIIQSTMLTHGGELLNPHE